VVCVFWMSHSSSVSGSDLSRIASGIAILADLVQRRRVPDQLHLVVRGWSCAASKRGRARPRRQAQYEAAGRLREHARARLRNVDLDSGDRLIRRGFQDPPYHVPVLRSDRYSTGTRRAADRSRGSLERARFFTRSRAIRSHQASVAGRHVQDSGSEAATGSAGYVVSLQVQIGQAQIARVAAFALTRVLQAHRFSRAWRSGVVALRLRGRWTNGPRVEWDQSVFRTVANPESSALQR
jgi:hypothetical protein